MKKRIVTIGGLALATLILVTSYAAAKLETGEKPAWALTTMEEVAIDSTTHAGKIVIIEFWATWCPPCVKQVPHLKQLYADYHEQGVELISVSVDQDVEKQKKFIKDNEMNWTHANDHLQSESLSDAWGVRGIPHAFIFSPDGALLWEGHPGNIDEPLKKAMTDHPPTVNDEEA